MRFRKKPVVIDAVQWNGSNVADIQLFMGDNPSLSLVAGNLEIHSLEGTMRAAVGDWILRGVQGEFYPCKPDIFAETYEPALEQYAQNVEYWRKQAVTEVMPDGWCDPNAKDAARWRAWRRHFAESWEETPERYDARADRLVAEQEAHDAE